MNSARRIKNNFARKINTFRVRNKYKIFCVGRNKTGTTSLKRAFKDLGYIVGQQRVAEELFDRYYFENDFHPIIEYCRTAEVFQDAPFSHFNTLRYVDEAYPGSKFILTVREDEEQWYRSITKFHSKLFGKNGQLPTFFDLQSAAYVKPGFMLNVLKAHGTSPEDPYNKSIMCKHYRRHNERVINYFDRRKHQLLVINVGEQNSYSKFLNFIGKTSSQTNFPWENKT